MSLEQTFFQGDIQKYTGIYFQSVSRMPFVDIKKWCSVNVISYAKQKHVCLKICKIRKGFGCVAGANVCQSQITWDS